MPWILCLLCFGALALGTEAPTEKKTVKAKALAPLKYKFNSFLGLGIAQGSSIVVGGQIGFPISETSQAFAGPELGFALYSPGTLYTILGTFWYEFSVDSTTKSALSLGAAAGMVATNNLPRLSSLSYAAFLDFAVSKEVDDDVFIRGQLRPGIVGNYFALWMNMNVTFLFR